MSEITDIFKAESEQLRQKHVQEFSKTCDAILEDMDKQCADFLEKFKVPEPERPEYLGFPTR